MSVGVTAVEGDLEERRWLQLVVFDRLIAQLHYSDSCSVGNSSSFIGDGLISRGFLPLEKKLYRITAMYCGGSCC